MFKLRETEKRTESINLRVTAEELAEINWCIEQLAAEMGRLSPQDIARTALGEFAAKLRASTTAKATPKRRR